MAVAGISTAQASFGFGMLNSCYVITGAQENVH